jgi:predicted P-loop ATPase
VLRDAGPGVLEPSLLARGREKGPFSHGGDLVTMLEPEAAGPRVPEIDPKLSALEQALALVGARLQVTTIHAPIATGDGVACTCGRVDCTAKGKHPVEKSWQRRPLTSDQEVRDAFARLKFTPNLGIVLGEQPRGAYVISIDEDDAERLELLEQEYGELPATASCKSARGRKLFFSVPPSVPHADLRNVTGLGGAKGVDVKVKGGQVVVPPSTHASGVRYEWVQAGLIAELPPGWIQAILKKPTAPSWATGYTPQLLRDDTFARHKAERYLNRALSSECGIVSGTKEGARNTVFYTALCRLLPLAHGLALPTGHSTVVRDLSGAAAHAGLGQREILSCVRSAEKWLHESGAVRLLPHPVEPVPPAPFPETATAAPGAAPEEPGEESVEAKEAFRELVKERAAAGIIYGSPAIDLIQANGKNAPVAENIARILERHPVWLGGPKLDTFRMTLVWKEVPAPVRKNLHDQWSELRERGDDLSLQGWLLQQPTELRIDAEKGTCWDGFCLCGVRNHFDSLVEYVDAMPEWDGTPRLDTFFPTYFGARPTDGTRRVGRAFLLAAMMRVYEPGNMVDVVPILESATQRVGKNRGIEALFGGPPRVFGLDIIPGDKNGDLNRLAANSWCLHDDESRLFMSRTDTIKAWITRTYDTYRVPYDRMLVTTPRRAVLICSTNKSHYFSDNENARFFPIKVGTVDVDGIARDREQVWAEARAAYRAGEKWFIPRTDPVWVELRREQEDRHEEDPFFQLVDFFLSRRDRPETPTSTTIYEKIGIEPSRRDQRMSNRLHAVMAQLGWEKVRVRNVAENLIKAGLEPGSSGERLHVWCKKPTFETTKDE